MTTIPYCGPAPAPAAVIAAWNLDPAVLAALAAAAWFLRSEPRAQLGLGALFIAYVSPICALSAGLFSARSIHHLLIVFGAAPFLASGLRIGGRLPASMAFLLHVIAFWAWHVPAVYAWALSSDAAYWLGQAALLGTSVLFWASLYRRDTSAPAAFFVLVAMVMQMGLLGAIITFVPEPAYAPHFFTTQLYGVSPLQDQQLAGLIMWVGSLPLTVAAGWAVLHRWLGAPQRAAAA